MDASKIFAFSLVKISFLWSRPLSNISGTVTDYVVTFKDVTASSATARKLNKTSTLACTISFGAPGNPRIRRRYRECAIDEGDG